MTNSSTIVVRVFKPRETMDYIPCANCMKLIHNDDAKVDEGDGDGALVCQEACEAMLIV